MRLSLDGRDLGTREISADTQVLDFALSETSSPRSTGVGRLVLESDEKLADGSLLTAPVIVEELLLTR
jgi:hypothetical protein